MRIDVNTESRKGNLKQGMTPPKTVVGAKIIEFFFISLPMRAHIIVFFLFLHCITIGVKPCAK
jgi:hypothetical protein